MRLVYRNKYISTEMLHRGRRLYRICTPPIMSICNNESKDCIEPCYVHSYITIENRIGFNDEGWSFCPKFNGGYTII